MRDIKNNIFSEKKYLLKKKKKEKELKRIQKKLRKRYKEEEKKRKILNKKTSNIKNKKKNIIKIPTLGELEIIFEKATDEYDKKIIEKRIEIINKKINYKLDILRK